MDIANVPELPDMEVGNWEYKAEGNFSMILTYVGNDKSILKGKVLRLFKKPLTDSPQNDYILTTDNIKRVLLHQHYISNFIRPYLPEVDAGEPYTVTSEFIESIAAKVEERRPHSRRNETMLNTKSKMAMVHIDHITRKSLTIELKPKWGFLPDDPLLDPNSIKRKVSRFQLMQHYKLNVGKITHISSFEPSELFSGDPDLVRHAIKCLMEEPQGNLKVFRNSVSSMLTDKEADILCDILVKLPTLKQLMSLQKLDLWDIECMAPIVERAKTPSWEALCFDKTVIEGIKEMITKEAKHPTTQEDCRQLLDKLSESDARVYVAGFLISQAAKDCSIMLTFDTGDIRDQPSVSVVDMDFKLADHIINHYIPQDRLVVQAYMDDLINNPQAFH